MRRNFYWDQMVHLRDKHAQVATDFGHPNARSLVVRRQVLPTGTLMPIATYLKIEPNPIITTVAPRTAAQFQGVSGVSIEIDDFQVSGVSHQYTALTALGRDGTGYSYFVDAELNLAGDALVRGIECDFVSITRQSTLTYDFVLRRRPDGRPENTTREYGL
jgi:hypothetical protein